MFKLPNLFATKTVECEERNESERAEMAEKEAMQ
jgi:hypothetical protein